MTSTKKAFIDRQLCDKSPFCPAKKSCPQLAITQKKKWHFWAEAPEIEQRQCVGCGRCVLFCPHGAIKMD